METFRVIVTREAREWTVVKVEAANADEARAEVERRIARGENVAEVGGWDFDEWTSDGEVYDVKEGE